MDALGRKVADKGPRTSSIALTNWALSSSGMHHSLLSQGLSSFFLTQSEWCFWRFHQHILARPFCLAAGSASSGNDLPVEVNRQWR